MMKNSDLLIPDISYNGDRTILEYVFTDHTRYNMCSKNKVVDFVPKAVEDCPNWDNCMWNGLSDNFEDYKDMILKPVAMFDNPFLKSPHKLVLCDVWLTLDEPSVINTRYSCKKTMERLKYDPVTGHRPQQLHDPLFGIEQEYLVDKNNGSPFSYDPEEMDPSFKIHYMRVDHPNNRNVSIERELSSKHLLACLYAGVKICGSNRETTPSTWEYQIGPCPGETIGDHLNVSRYILHRLAEMCGLRVSLCPVTSPDKQYITTAHLNFSTQKMREKDGIIFIRRAIDLLSKSEDGPLLDMYDPRLTGNDIERLETFHKKNTKFSSFVVNIGKKRFTTIRIPPLVDAEGCGYFEDRRPSGVVDPYAAAEGIVRASIFGDYLKPGYEHLKDLSFWDSQP